MTRNKVIEAAATVAESLSSTLARYKTRISRGPKLAAACVAATIADGLVAVIHVVDSHGQGHAPTLARGMIESMLDLEMVCTNADYLKPLRLATAQGKIAIGQQFLSQAKMLTKEQQDAVRADLREQALIVEDLERQGIKPLSIEEKFMRAPKSGVLWTYYWHFCSSAHNDLRALASRHLRGNHIILGETLSDDDVRETLVICAGIALNVYEYIPTFLMVTAEQLQPEWEALGPLLRRLAGAPTKFQRIRNDC